MFVSLLRTVFLSSCLILPALSMGANTPIPVGDKPAIFKGEELNQPHNTDKFYAYANSKNFSRWVFSPWAETKSINGKVTLTPTEDAKKRSVLISELSFASDHLNPQKNYRVIFENNYECLHSNLESKGSCRLKLMVRCYGKTAKAEWGTTFEKVSDFKVKDSGKVSLAEVSLPGEKCREGIHVSSEGSLLPNTSTTYAFKDMRIGLKEL
ncbi:MAG: hypothetical protein HRU19_09880 [Pseudobacteriovorax sp.]|nr:hypothetical protein [Pseudobacteriovorax sp.]